MKNIGLLGGSFDPPHRGHIYISLEAKKILSLDEVWWLVTPQNPLKITRPATYEERVDNCNNITKNCPIVVKELEKNISSKNSYQTIKYLLHHYNNIKFYWLMGADNLVNFHNWQNWRQFFNQISIVIFRRHGYNNAALRSTASKTFVNYQINTNQLNRMKFNSLPSWSFIQNREIRISSTEIRKQRELLRR
ncbi:MAG: nicotinate (nicotinamide) nucleotide adenylyltransferase [Chloroflexi bacterium]|nr:nicotinate (nicotinamide) nucleotide adenylyltransferase [Chloroflexota bacterium]